MKKLIIRLFDKYLQKKGLNYYVAKKAGSVIETWYLPRVNTLEDGLKWLSIEDKNLITNENGLLQVIPVEKYLFVVPKLSVLEIMQFTMKYQKQHPEIYFEKGFWELLVKKNVIIFSNHGNNSINAVEIIKMKGPQNEKK